MTAPTLFLEGMFNTIDPLFGFPIYFWGWIILTIVAGVLWLAYYFLSWKPLEPLHGLYYSMRDGSSCAFIFNKDLVGELVSERDAKCIFKYAEDEYGIDVPDQFAFLLKIPGLRKLTMWTFTKLFYYPTLYLDNISPVEAIMYKIMGRNMDVEIAKYLEGGDWEQSASVICAGVPVEIILDMGRWTIQNSPQHRAIENYCRQWNLDHEKDQIHSYMKFQKYLFANKFDPMPEGIKISDIVPWQRIDAAFPLNFDPNEYAGKIRQMAVDIENEQKSPFNQYAVPAFLVCAGIGVFFYIGRLVLALVT